MAKTSNRKRKRATDALFRAAKVFNEKKGNIDNVSGSSDAPATETATVRSVPLHATVHRPQEVIHDVTISHDELVDAEDDNNFSSSTISDSDLAITIQTLERLVAHPSAFHSKRFKGLRRTIHPLVVEQLQSYDKGIDYRQRVTLALSHQHWSDALAALRACKDFQQYPKQGTVQRWVRDCTGAIGTCHMQLLHAILQVNHGGGDDNDNAMVDSTIVNKHDPGQALADHLANNRASVKDGITILDGWRWWVDNDKDDNDDAGHVEGNANGTSDGDDDHSKNVHGDDDPLPANPDDHGTNAISSIQSRIVYQEDAADRTPPNHWDLVLHATEPGCIQWSALPPPTAIHRIPFLADHSSARLLSNVLTSHECQQFLNVTTHLGYRKDHPVSLEAPTGIDSCEWMVDDSIARVLLERVQSHLPATLTLPGKSSSISQQKHMTVQLHGINPRWRCFRYGQDCVYRPHLDGSWPQCFIDDDGTYQCPKQSDVKSYLTFLIYLNDNFDGGETRFYLPNGQAQGIVPKTGCVAIFPQGNIASLIHEGTQVTRGTKYVIRTDVLYRKVVLESSLSG